MQESNKFLGMDKGNLPVLGLQLTILAVVISLFNMQNSAINRLEDNMTATRAELKEDIRELGNELDSLEDDMDALGSDLNALKIDTAEIKVRVEEIERRMSPLEAVDGRLDELEREQARLRERVDALSSDSE